MDLAQLALSLFIPILISLVAYFGHRSLTSIDDDLKDLKKESQKLKDQIQKIDRSIEIVHAETKVNHNELTRKIISFKNEALELKTDLKENQLKQLKTEETQGKILLILNKVVTELKKQPK